MMFLKYLCCKESLTASITTGEIKTLDTFKNPMLEVHIQLSMGGINPSTDFLYLQPQVEASKDPHSLASDGEGGMNSTNGRKQQQQQNGRTAPSTEKTTQTTNNSIRKQSPRQGSSSAANGQVGFGGPDDREPLPRRLRDVKKDRVILIERGSALCENVGLAYIDYMNIEKGRYKLYFMRIESEQRIMYNSKLELIGSSNAFSINNVVVDKQGGKRSARRTTIKDILEGNNDSFQSQSKESHQRWRNENIILGSDGFNDSSDLDSLLLMNQIQGQCRMSVSNSQSVHSSDNTQAQHHSPGTNRMSDNPSFINNKPGQGHSRSLAAQQSNCSSNANSSSQFSCGSSTVTCMVKNENNEAMIVTQSRIGNPGALAQSLSKHRRGINIQSVLEDISTAKYANCGTPMVSRNARENNLNQCKTYDICSLNRSSKAKTANIQTYTAVKDQNRGQKIQILGKENAKGQYDSAKTLQYLNQSISTSQATGIKKSNPTFKKNNLYIESYPYDQIEPHSYYE